MAIPSFNLCSSTKFLRFHSKPSLAGSNRKLPLVTAPTSFPSEFRLPSPLTRYRGFKFPIPRGNKQSELFEKFREVLPGGSWWNICDSENETVNSATSMWSALWRMWELLANDQWIVSVAFGFLIVAAASEITMPRVLAESIFSAQNLQSSAFLMKARLLAVLCFISGVSSGLRSGCFSIANTILIKRLREALYSALIFQNMPFFDREEVGGLTSRLGADCQRLSHVIANDVHLIARNVLQAIGAVINLLTLSWPLALSSLLICSVLATIFMVYGQYQKTAAKITQDVTACANMAVEETFSLIRTVRAYGTEVKEHGRYKQWLEKLANVNVRESVAYGFWTMSFSTLYRLTQIFAVLLGGMSIMTGNVSTEQLTKYVLYCEWLIYATWRIVDNISSLLQATGANEKVFQLLQLSPSDQFMSQGVKLQRLMGQIQFVDVSFHYPSRPAVPILENLHLSVQANEVIALVGPSGSGKTTLVHLLLRLYEPTNGQIYIDGFPLKDLDVRWLRENIGYVGQELELFHMDVKSNITYGCHREICQEEIENAARRAYAHEFISALPDGYQTIVHDSLLSGGQKQRIAIARAMLRYPAILILDEATSALDSESEHFVKGILQEFKNGKDAKRSVIVVAHRLSTIEAADRIIVMDGGRIVEMGNHKDLLLNKGLYSHLVKIQRNYLEA
ncbi:hypothetical protein K2173_020279 [Erythroxylum novogranatense]|uniref:ABC transporter B family member 26, chloroplastic n=1 Tax=Erythroxylum novogranatense TaxID=1862640 RepID=A0AAV8UBD3_9ROSI|nr:hypothetical protein K2173_020279 [Erythroxylum novogranatense]